MDSQDHIFFNPELCRNETEVESKFIVSYLLPALGYGPSDWSQELTIGKIRLDFMVSPEPKRRIRLGEVNPRIIIEAKGPGTSLNNHVRKLLRYLTMAQVNCGVLCNGKFLRIYQRQADEKFAMVFECRGREVEGAIDTIRQYLGRQARSDSAPSPDPKPTERTMKKIAVYHNKGGVGKTTTVTNLAAALAHMGNRVLIVDLDAQANSTFAAGLIKFENEEDDTIKDNYVIHVMRSESLGLVSEVARLSTYCSKPVHVIPSHINLMREESEFTVSNNVTGAIFAQQNLRSKIEAAEANFDYVLIDTPPSLNFFAQTALFVADYLIVPSDLKPFANQGLRNVTDFLYRMNQTRAMLKMNIVKILGVLPVKVSPNAQFVQYSLPKRIERVENIYGYGVFNSVIYERDVLAQCVEQVEANDVPNPLSIFDFKPDSPSAGEFEALAKEVIQKVS